MVRARRFTADERPRYRSLALITTILKRSFYPFPIDMLRYDKCHPLTEHDAHVVEESIRSEGGDEHYGVVVVRLHDGADPRWSVARWESYGFEVERIGEEQAAALERERTR